MGAEGSALTGRLLTFRVGPGRYAVLLEDVLGVQDPAGVGVVAEGRVLFQGASIAAVDAPGRWWSGAAPPATTAPPAVIIVGSRGRSTALVVDRVEGIVEGVEMQPLPALVARFVRGIFRGVTLHADCDRLVVDPAALSGEATVGGHGGPGEA